MRRNVASFLTRVAMTQADRPSQHRTDAESIDVAQHRLERPDEFRVVPEVTENVADAQQGTRI